MTTPYRGGGQGYRGRGRGRGRGYEGNKRMPHLEVPLIGSWSDYINNVNKNKQQSGVPSKKEDIPSSSSSSKIISYKDIIVSEVPQELEYFENPITEHILYIEDEDLQMTTTDGWSLKTRYLESRGYAGLHGQSRVHLEILLSISESVTITHHYQNNNPESFINFSKCHINKILLPREWGLNPNSDRAIKLAEEKYIYFNYWDYIQAFTKAFYYQNPKNKHSWFFSVNPEVLKRPVPNWFYNWWAKFGPSLEILPKEIMDLYNPWCDNSPLVLKIQSERLIYGQCPFTFFTKFQIPWIWRWSISISTDKLEIPILERNFFFKWWNKMSPEDIGKIISNIKSTLVEDKGSGSKDCSQQPLSMANLKDYFQKKYPKESPEDIMVRVLDYIKNQFCNTFPVQTSKDGVDSMKTVSSHGSLDSNKFNCLAGESQEEENPSPSPAPEDIWDALIETISQNARNKGKAHLK